MSIVEDKKVLMEHFKRVKILTDKNIISAFNKVKREDFVIPKLKKYAYIDEPLPIGKGQTISQPTTVAIMTQALEPKKNQKILEVGSGSGYQAAILAEIIGSKGKIITIERIKEIYEYAKDKLKKYKNVKVILSDGSKGYKKLAPFDRIIVTAAAEEIPKPLFKQLKEKGIMIIPVGKTSFSQRLLKIRKIKRKIEQEDLGPFVFVPLITSPE